MVNIGANLALIPTYSAAGAAAATTFSYLVETVVAFALLAPDIGVPRVVKGLAPAAVASAVDGGGADPAPGRRCSWRSRSAW